MQDIKPMKPKRGLVAWYDILPGNRAGISYKPRARHGARRCGMHSIREKEKNVLKYTTTILTLIL